MGCDRPLVYVYAGAGHNSSDVQNFRWVIILMQGLGRWAVQSADGLYIRLQSACNTERASGAIHPCAALLRNDGEK